MLIAQMQTMDKKGLLVHTMVKQDAAATLNMIKDSFLAPNHFVRLKENIPHKCRNVTRMRMYPMEETAILHRSYCS